MLKQNLTKQSVQTYVVKKNQTWKYICRAQKKIPKPLNVGPSTIPESRVPTKKIQLKLSTPYLLLFTQLNIYMLQICFWKIIFVKNISPQSSPYYRVILSRVGSVASPNDPGFHCTIFRSDCNQKGFC